ncbi:MAG: metal-dependent hydrolase [Acidobacteria bacterium]|nr:metal-dependent hydrolase [Acidobacteriota bacterium]
MPSPVGHVLGGLAAGWLVETPRPNRHWLVYGAAGALPDLDLIVGTHRGLTHSIVAAVAVGFAVAAIASTARASAPWKFGAAAGAAWASHVLLDWLGSDTSAPIGVMALWPFSHAYFESGLHVFMAVSRRYWLPEFVGHNLRALGREVVVLGPLVAAIRWWRRPDSKARQSIAREG